MKNVIVFVLGAALGSLVTWKFIDEKYKRLAQKEIDEVREYYKGKKANDKTVTLTVNQDHSFDVTDEDVIDIPSEDYVNILTGLGYSEEEARDLAEDPDVSIEKNEDGEYEVFIEPPSTVAPFVISPEEYGEIPEYNQECWTLYADGILTNDDDQIVDEEEIDMYIGDALKHFGDYEKDSIHVRNENTGIECDIEILKHNETYDEVHGGIDNVDDYR